MPDNPGCTSNHTQPWACDCQIAQKYGIEKNQTCSFLERRGNALDEVSSGKPDPQPLPATAWSLSINFSLSNCLHTSVFRALPSTGGDLAILAELPIWAPDAAGVKPHRGVLASVAVVLPDLATDPPPLTRKFGSGGFPCWGPSTPAARHQGALFILLGVLS